MVYGDVVYDRPSSDAFSNKLNNADLGIPEAIKDTYREYLQQRRWMRRLCLFHKVVSTKLPAYIYDIIPPVSQSQRHPNTFNSISCRTECFKKSLFFLGYW